MDPPGGRSANTTPRSWNRGTAPPASPSPTARWSERSLDRNGLRPGRWWRTIDDRIVLASETGVLDIPSAEVVAKGRLEPGKMFLVDTGSGRIVSDDEIKGHSRGRAVLR